MTILNRMSRSSLTVLGVPFRVVGVPFVAVPGVLPGEDLGAVECPGEGLSAVVCAGLGHPGVSLGVLLGSLHLRAGSLKGR